MRVKPGVVPLLALLLSGCLSGADRAPDRSPRDAATAPPNHQTLGVNIYLWHAALDTLSFLPLRSADPFGGVINSDWYASPTNAGERVKVTVYIMDRALRADGLKVVVFRQSRDGAGWQPAQASPDTARKLENAILARARELRLATLEGPNSAL